MLEIKKNRAFRIPPVEVDGKRFLKALVVIVAYANTNDFSHEVNPLVRENGKVEWALLCEHFWVLRWLLRGGKKSYEK